MLVIRRLPRPDQDGKYPLLDAVDGVQRAELVDDATAQIGLTPGEHRVEVRVKWCGSREVPITLEPGQILRMECRPRGIPLLALLYITLWRNRYIAIETVKSWTP